MILEYEVFSTVRMFKYVVMFVLLIMYLYHNKVNLKTYSNIYTWPENLRFEFIFHNLGISDLELQCKFLEKFSLKCATKTRRRKSKVFVQLYVPPS